MSYISLYEITDSEFGIVSGTSKMNTLGLWDIAVLNDVIDLYEKRNLNVAANLMKAIVWNSKSYRYSVADSISYCKRYIPEFAKYEKDIDWKNIVVLL